MKRGGLAALLGIAQAVKMPYLVVILKWAGASVRHRPGRV